MARPPMPTTMARPQFAPRGAARAPAAPAQPRYAPAPAPAPAPATPNAQQSPTAPRTYAPQASPYQGQLTAGIQEMLALPSAYDSHTVRGTYNVLDRQITNAGRTAANQIDDTYAARGLRVSTPARTAQGDLAVELDRNRRDAAQMLVDAQARDYGTARAAAIQTALGAQRQQEESDLATFGANEEAIDRAYGRKLAGDELTLSRDRLTEETRLADADRGVRERLGLGDLNLRTELGRGELALGRDRMTQDGRLADADRAVRERLGIGALDVDYARLMTGEAQFGANLGENQRQYNASDYREGQRIGISRAQADSDFFRTAAGMIVDFAGLPGFGKWMNEKDKKNGGNENPPPPPPPPPVPGYNPGPNDQNGDGIPDGQQIDTQPRFNASVRSGADIGGSPTPGAAGTPTLPAGMAGALGIDGSNPRVLENPGSRYVSPLASWTPSWRGGAGGALGMPGGTGGGQEYRFGEPWSPSRPAGPVDVAPAHRPGAPNLWTPPGMADPNGPNPQRAAALQRIINEYAITPDRPRTGEVIPFSQMPAEFDPTLTGEAYDRQWELRKAGWVPNTAAGGWITPQDLQSRFFTVDPTPVYNPDGTRDTSTVGRPTDAFAGAYDGYTDWLRDTYGVGFANEIPDTTGRQAAQAEWDRRRRAAVGA
jgi:hypothetical protein